MTLSLWLSGALVGTAAIVALVRPSRFISELRENLQPIAVLVVAGATACAVAIAARRYVEVGDYIVSLVIGTSSFLALLFLLYRARSAPSVTVTAIERVHPGLVAVAVFVASVAAGFLVLEGVPHVSDEVAYLFQARVLATGRLWMEAPQQPEFFRFIHLVIDDGRWYGTMNQGWPLLLAGGVAAGIPWAVAPVLAALTILCFFSYFRDAGLDGLEARLAILLIAVSPLFVFLSGSYMSHAASLFTFAGFLCGWIRHRKGGGLGAAFVAGGFLALGVFVRPLDSALVALPFVLLSAWDGLRERRRLVGVAVLGVTASLGAVASLVNNRALTGQALVFPATRFFALRDPGQRFGIGFGSNMGTTIHGAEWPGYYPADVIPVSSYRIAEFLQNVHALPVLLLALVGWSLLRDRKRRDPEEWALVGSAGVILALYAFHFYHGIAYGSRHLYPLLPVVAVLMARPIARWLRAGSEGVSRLAAAGLIAGGAYVVLFAYPPLVREYGTEYRSASAWVRDAVADAGLGRALVFVDESGWAWKSAFPLNGIPLDENDVVFALDLGARNRELAEAHPDRAAYRLRREEGRAVLEPLAELGAHDTYETVH